MPSSARIWATATGWLMYGSPLRRTWPSWSRWATSCARCSNGRSALAWMPRWVRTRFSNRECRRPGQGRIARTRWVKPSADWSAGAAAPGDFGGAGGFAGGAAEFGGAGAGAAGAAMLRELGNTESASMSKGATSRTRDRSRVERTFHPNERSGHSHGQLVRHVWPLSPVVITRFRVDSHGDVGGAQSCCDSVGLVLRPAVGYQGRLQATGSEPGREQLAERGEVGQPLLRRRGAEERHEPLPYGGG